MEIERVDGTVKIHERLFPALYAKDQVRYLFEINY